MIIGFDLDGCVVNLIDKFIRIANADFRCDLRPEDITDFTIENIPGVPLTGEQVGEIICQCLESQDDLLPHCGSIHFIKAYYDMVGRPPIFVTSRSPKFRKATEGWINTHLVDVPFDLIESKNKITVCHALELDYFIEDHIMGSFPEFDNKRGIVPSGYKTIVLVPDRPWNSSISIDPEYKKYVVRFYQWISIHKMLLGGERLW